MAQIAQDTDRDNFMSAEQSVEYGLIDQVLDRRLSQEPQSGKG
jgi:ATP-dependent Clp protease protease subunit